MRVLKVLLFLAISIGFPSRGHSLCCDPGWLQYNEKFCFFFNHDPQGKAVWKDAVSICCKLGGRLADILDEDELNFVKAQLRSPNQYMIGITAEQRDGQWKFLNRGDAFVKWAGNQPDHAIETCGALFSVKGYRGLYNNIRCDEQGSSTIKVDFGTFICKKEAK